MATGVPLDVPVSEIFKTLSDLFDHVPAPALMLEAFWSQRQLAIESVDTYTGALPEVALRAFLNESRETEFLRQFSLSVRNTELYSKFVRKQYTSLLKALEVARDYEVVEVNHCQLTSTHLFSVAEGRLSSRRTHLYSIGGRQNSPASCAYCRRFGRRAQRYSHNPSIRPQSMPGRYAPSVVSLSYSAVLSHGVRTLLTIPGTLNGRMVPFLLDTEAFCLVVCSNLQWVSYESPSRLAQFSTENDSVLRPDERACCSAAIGDFTTKHTFVRTRTQWDVILGMDFLDRHHASIEFSPLRTCLDGIEIFRMDTREAIAPVPWWVSLFSGSATDESLHQAVVRLLEELAAQ
ncbi:hypothetical protein SprV_0100178600 [Sparganum proliferum]